MFHFTDSIRVVCDDICLRLAEFHHVRMTQVGVSICQTRGVDEYGVFASLTPLGVLRNTRTGAIVRRSSSQPILDEHRRPILYLLTFYMPRFQNLPLREKFDTIIHELYHIGEEFDGDLRRFQGRCYAHGSSRKKYDRIIRELVEKWLSKDPPLEVWEFLQYDFKQLVAQRGRVVGTKIAI